MAIKTTDFLALTDDLQELTSTWMKDKVDGMETSNLLFDVKDMVRRTYDLQINHGTAGIERVGDGSDYPRANNTEGDSITYTQAKYGVIVPVTEDMRLYDLYDNIESNAKSVVDEGMDKIDQSLADVLLYGQATSYTDVYGETVSALGPDAAALFTSTKSNGATAATFSNLITNTAGTANVALARDAIVSERARALTYKDVNGLNRPIHLDCLVVAPTNEDLAERLLFSTQIPGEANNDVNSLKGKLKNLKVWSRLEERSDGTDTSAYWYMADSSNVKTSLKAIFATRPQLVAPDQVYENDDWEYKFKYRYAIGFGWAPYIRMSTGAN